MPHPRKIFVDCGAFDGDSVRLFRRKFPGAAEYEVHCFEPDVRVGNHEPDLAGNHRLAVWTDFGTRPLRIGRPQCSSLIAEKTTGNLKAAVEVPTIDFAWWLRYLIIGDRPAARVVLKLDIEGAEYPVLWQMIRTGAIDLIDELYVGWHWHKIGMAESAHNDLVDRLRSLGLTAGVMDLGKIARPELRR